uniref:Lipid droplet-associated hydrolase n=1 Tax=Sarcophilus harrisii TaxID=9305 RepID=A0A7N4UXM6_SARHA
GRSGGFCRGPRCWKGSTRSSGRAGLGSGACGWPSWVSPPTLTVQSLEKSASPWDRLPRSPPASFSALRSPSPRSSREREGWGVCPQSDFPGFLSGPSRDQEMKVIVERDNATIQKHLKKLIFYYGKSDLWCPVQYYEDLKKDFPGGDIKLCEKGIQHAFVLSSNQEMAALIADWLRDDLSKL